MISFSDQLKLASTIYILTCGLRQNTFIYRHFTLHTIYIHDLLNSNRATIPIFIWLEIWVFYNHLYFKIEKKSSFEFWCLWFSFLVWRAGSLKYSILNRQHLKSSKLNKSSRHLIKRSSSTWKSKIKHRWIGGL